MGVMMMKMKAIIALRTNGEGKKCKTRVETYELILWIQYYGQHTRCGISILRIPKAVNVSKIAQTCAVVLLVYYHMSPVHQ